MTQEQRKAIEILNSIKDGKKEDGKPVINDDDYYLLMSFVINKEVVCVPQIPPYEPIKPFYVDEWKVTCDHK